jgi:hypothetical protein
MPSTGQSPAKAAMVKIGQTLLVVGRVGPCSPRCPHKQLPRACVNYFQRHSLLSIHEISVHLEKDEPLPIQNTKDVPPLNLENVYGRYPDLIGSSCNGNHPQGVLVVAKESRCGSARTSVVFLTSHAGGRCRQPRRQRAQWATSAVLVAGSSAYGG